MYTLLHTIRIPIKSPPLGQALGILLRGEAEGMRREAGLIQSPLGFSCLGLRLSNISGEPYVRVLIIRILLFRILD